MRLKPVRGSIIGKTSAMASNNEITPEVKHRVGEHLCVCEFVHGKTWNDGERETKMFVQNIIK